MSIPQGKIDWKRMARELEAENAELREENDALNELLQHEKKQHEHDLDTVSQMHEEMAALEAIEKEQA